MSENDNNSKCFIKSENGFEEITYRELLYRLDANPIYAEKKFIPQHGMLMEVTCEEYAAFYKEINHQLYLNKEAISNGEFSFDMLTTDEFNGEDILVDSTQDVAEQAEKNIMMDKLKECLPMLKSKEQELIDALFYKGLSEREFSKVSGIPQKTINDRKRRILAKLKKYLEK